jgi:hypothetical protein
VAKLALLFLPKRSHPATMLKTANPVSRSILHQIGQELGEEWTLALNAEAMQRCEASHGTQPKRSIKTNC